MRGLGTVAAAIALAARFVKCKIGKIAKLVLLPLFGAGDDCAANPCAVPFVTDNEVQAAAVAMPAGRQRRQVLRFQ